MATNQGGNGGKSNRGFASMPQDRQREIASQGGRAAHRDGTAHEFTSEEAREAGRKGGEARALRSQLARQQAVGDNAASSHRSSRAEEGRGDASRTERESA